MSSWGFRYLFSWLLGSAWVFALKQRFFVRFFLPFKTRPLLECLFGSLSLSLFLLLFGCFLSAVVACLSSLLFRRWGNTNRVPSWPRSSSSTRTPATATTPRRGSRTCCFCRFLGLFSLSASLSLSLSLSLALCFSLSLSGVGRPGCACRYDRIHGGGVQDGAPNYNHDCFFWASFWGRASDSAPDSPS